MTQDTGCTGELFELSSETFERLLQGAKHSENQYHSSRLVFNNSDDRHVWAAPPAIKTHITNRGDEIEVPNPPPWRED